jgi:periplasmic divalent cation tolerance protein
MKTKGNYCVVLVTCATVLQAKLIARTVVELRLAACVNIVSNPVESYYRWKNRVERSRELLLIIKTTAKKLAALESEVKRLHSYDVPEFLVLPVETGSADYLKWISDSVG